MKSNVTGEFTQQQVKEQELRFNNNFPKIDLSPYASELRMRLLNGEEVYQVCNEMSTRIGFRIDVIQSMYIPSKLKEGKNVFYGDEIRYAIIKRMVQMF